MSESPFSSLIIAALVLAAAALAIGTIITDSSATYEQDGNTTIFTNITESGRGITTITNATANNFYGNKTTTTTTTAIDRMVGAAYGSMLVVGETPTVFINIVENVSGGIGLPGYSTFIIGAILAIIVGIALWLAVGRR